MDLISSILLGFLAIAAVCVFVGFVALQLLELTGNLLMKSANYEGAINVFSFFLKLHKIFGGASLLGLCNSRIGEALYCLGDLELAEEYSTDGVIAYLGIIKCLDFENNNEYISVETAFTNAPESSSKSDRGGQFVRKIYDAYFWRAKARIKLKRFELAFIDLLNAKSFVSIVSDSGRAQSLDDLFAKIGGVASVEEFNRMSQIAPWTQGCIKFDMAGLMVENLKISVGRFFGKAN
jgi:tetratricopeptide (TPR) repeat protein